MVFSRIDKWPSKVQRGKESRKEEKFEFLTSFLTIFPSSTVMFCSKNKEHFVSKKKSVIYFLRHFADFSMIVVFKSKSLKILTSFGLIKIL